MSSSSESHLNVYVRPPHTSSWVLFSCFDLKPFLSRCNSARALGHQWVKTPNKQVSAPSGSPSVVLEVQSHTSSVSIPWEFVRKANSGTPPQTGWIQLWRWDQAMCIKMCDLVHPTMWEPLHLHTPRGLGGWRGYFQPWGWSELLHCDGINIAIDLFSFFQGHEKNLKYWLTDTNL